MRIIAIGSPFNDDSIAWRCLRTLETALASLSSGVDIQYCDHPGTGLIHALEPAVNTVLVDALLTEGAAAGQVQAVNVQDLYNTGALSSHDISVANVLQLARNLDRLPRRLNILGITVDPSMPLSSAQVEQVEQALLAQLEILAE